MVVLVVDASWQFFLDASQSLRLLNLNGPKYSWC
jgi:hypothetical protein